MTKIIRMIAHVIDGVAHGLAQMGSLGQSDAREPIPRKTAEEALRGDWEQLGRDMERTIDAMRRRRPTRR